MALRVGELYAVMRMDDSQFRQGIDQSKGKFEGLRSAIGSGVKTIATAFAATTTAVAGLGVAAFKVGLDYNRMQQSSRAALTTLLGSAEAASAQMDKLDEFARTSPFAKQVFISAQQQLIGFGMAADKVLPTLDAIQNAVAAVGGSSDDIAEVTRILAVVQSSGKITAETLNQLGTRGIDAATLIGESMGMTGAQIRESITKGSLDAGDAIEALTEGMMARFGGATAKIKEQMDGAADRVKGAFRDIGSALAAPFIDPKGGGYLVQWTNDVADGMRNFEAKLRPLVSLLVDRFSPGLARVSPLIQSAGDAINAWDLAKVNGQLDRLGRYTPVIAGVATAMFSLGTQSMPILGAINPLVAGFAALAATSPEVRRMFSDAARSLEPLVPMMGALALTVGDVAMEVIARLAPAFGDLLAAGGELAVTMGSALLPAVSGLVTAAVPLAEVLATVVGWVADLPQPVQMAAVAFLAMQGPLKPIAEGLAGVATGMLRIIQQAQVQAALGNTNIAMGGLASSSMRASTAIGAVGGALKMAFMGNALLLAISGIVAALGHFANKAAEAKRKAQDYQATLDDLGNATEDTADRIYQAISEVQAANWLDGLFGNEKSIMQRADTLGVAIEDVIGYIQGEQQAIDNVTAATEAYIEANSEGRRERKNAETVVQIFMDLLGEEAVALILAKESQEELNRAREAGGDADRDAADAADAHLAAVQALRDEHEAGIDATLSAAEAALRVADAQAAAEEAIRRKIEADRELEEVLASSTATEEERAEATRRAEQAGRDAERQNLSYTRAIDDNIAAMGRNNESSVVMRQEMARARDDFIRQQVSLGATRGEAEALADSYGLIPSRVNTIATFSSATARSEVYSYMSYLNQQFAAQGTPTRRVATGQGGSGGMTNYHGNIVEFMAVGGLTPMSPVAQMVPPNTWRVVGDRGDVDEAYIPLDGSRRSIDILAEAVRRMPNLRPFALGGVAASPSTTHPRTTTATLARIAPEDMRALAQTVAAELAPLVPGVERSVRDGFDDFRATEHRLARMGGGV